MLYFLIQKSSISILQTMKIVVVIAFERHVLSLNLQVSFAIFGFIFSTSLTFLL